MKRAFKRFQLIKWFAIVQWRVWCIDLRKYGSQTMSDVPTSVLRWYKLHAVNKLRGKNIDSLEAARWRLALCAVHRELHRRKIRFSM